MASIQRRRLFSLIFIAAKHCAGEEGGQIVAARKKVTKSGSWAEAGGGDVVGTETGILMVSSWYPHGILVVLWCGCIGCRQAGREHAWLTRCGFVVGFGIIKQMGAQPAFPMLSKPRQRAVKH